LALGHPETAPIHERIGDLRVRTGDYPGAITAYETAAATTSPERLAALERRVARIHLRRGDLAAAEAHLAAALVALDAVGGSAGSERSGVVADAAVAAIRRGDAVRATALASEARELAGDEPVAEAEALRILGLLDRDRGDLEEARRTLERSLQTAEGLDDRLPAIAATNALALVAADAGDADAAIGLVDSALAMARQTGDRHLEAALENNLADALEAAGRRDEAMEHLKVAAAAFADIAAVGDEPEPGIWMLESW
jgi:tetratricopeptide (TPR) repeat protein